MRLWVGFATAAVAGAVACAPRPQPPAVPAPPATLPSPAVSPTAAPDPPAPEPPAASGDTAPDFARDVQPILARACNPCHFPGGKMYGPMPFDDAKTVASHKEGVLRRLKGSDRATAERWLSVVP